MIFKESPQLPAILARAGVDGPGAVQTSSQALWPDCAANQRQEDTWEI